MVSTKSNARVQLLIGAVGADEENLQKSKLTSFFADNKCYIKDTIPEHSLCYI
jgi:hypothetical protein